MTILFCLVMSVIVLFVCMKKINNVEKELKERSEKFVECKRCGCLIRKDTAKKVENLDSITVNYYCSKCKPPYDEVCYGRYFKKIAETEIEVDEKGKPIKRRKK